MSNIHDLDPTPETIAAMEAARRGELTTVRTIDELFVDLNSNDESIDPSSETIAAMEAARRGELTAIETIDELFVDLNS